MILVIKHIAIEGPGIIGEFIRGHKWQMQVVELHQGDKLPDNLDDIEAIIILGGPMNAYEEEKFPFLRDEDIFIKEALERQIPILGICLGAQLLAKAVGSEIKKAEIEELGWRKVDLTEDGKNDSFFEGLSGQLDVFQWHEDCFDIPQPAILLATSSACPNQAFRFGKNAYGLQFHIEITLDMLKSWVEEYMSEDRRSLAEVEKMFSAAVEKKEHVRQQANKILFNFFRLVFKK